MRKHLQIRVCLEKLERGGEVDGVKTAYRFTRERLSRPEQDLIRDGEDGPLHRCRAEPAAETFDVRGG